MRTKFDVATRRSRKQTCVSRIRSSSHDEPRSGPRALEPESRAWARREELLRTESIAPRVHGGGSGTVQQERERERWSSVVMSGPPGKP